MSFSLVEIGDIMVVLPQWRDSDGPLHEAP